MRKLKFPKKLILKYSEDFSLVSDSEKGHYDESTGKWVENKTTDQMKRGVIVPYKNSVIYQSGGTILQSDREVITLEKLPAKARIKHHGQSYTLTETTDYDDYSYFFTYQARRVDAFD